MIDIQKARLAIVTHTQYGIDAPDDPLDAKEKILKQRKLDRKRVALERSLTKHEQDLKYAWQEAKFFMQMFAVLEKIEKLKDYDDLEAQKEYWNERLSQQITLKMLLQQPLDTELVQTTLALHEDAPIRIQTLRTLRHVEGQMNNLKKQYLRLMQKEKDGKTEDNKS